MNGTIQLGISTVMAGEIVPTVDGFQSVVVADSVCLTPFVEGVEKPAYYMTPEQAQALAVGLCTAAGQLINAEVDDAGKPTSLVHRLRRISGATS
jgi:hypothetical protein